MERQHNSGDAGDKVLGALLSPPRPKRFRRVIHRQSKPVQQSPNQKSPGSAMPDSAQGESDDRIPVEPPLRAPAEGSAKKI